MAKLTKKSKAGRPLLGDKPRKRVLYSLDESILTLWNSLTKKKNRSQLIEQFMRAYVAEHGQDPL